MSAHRHLLILLTIIIFFHTTADHGHGHSNTSDHGHSHGHSNTSDHGHSNTSDHGHSHGHSNTSDHGHSHGNTSDHGHSHSHSNTSDHSHSHSSTSDHGHSHSHSNTSDHGHSHSNTSNHSHSNSSDHGHSHSHGHGHGQGLYPVNETALEEKCNQTLSPGPCLTLTRLYAPHFATIDDMAMFQMLTNGTADGARIMAVKASLFAHQPGTSKDVKDNLMACSEAFKDSLRSLNIVNAAAAKNNGKRVIAHLEVVKANVGHCNVVLQKEPAEKPVASDTEVLLDVAEMALSYAHLAFKV